MIVVATKHLLFAASQGHDEALQKVKAGYVEGLLIKHEFAQALRANKSSQDVSARTNQSQVKIIGII